jgi:DNA-binding transcriptional LysR family regulator
MTLEQLRIFVAVAEREHVTRAAVDLNLTQSATSAAIAALEARYAIKLFNRIGRRIELTQAGRLFLVEARAVLARAATAEIVLDDIAGLKRGSLRLAASQTVGNYWLPPLMYRYRASYPGIALALTIGNTEKVADAVLLILDLSKGRSTIRHYPSHRWPRTKWSSSSVQRYLDRTGWPCRRRISKPCGGFFVSQDLPPAPSSKKQWRKPDCVFQISIWCLNCHRMRRFAPLSRTAPGLLYCQNWL